MKYLNIVSNLVYPIAGYFGDWITFVAGIVLCLGSATMHFYEEMRNKRPHWTILADWFGMYAFSLAVLATLTTPWVLALLIPIALLRDEMRDTKLIGVIVLLTIAIAQSWMALICFAVAFVVRQRWENSKWQDYSHTFWHFATATGYYLILIGY